MKALRRWLARFLCRFRGHRFDSLTFRANRLYFCRHCGTELLGRTWSDLTPEPWSDSDAWEPQ